MLFVKLLKINSMRNSPLPFPSTYSNQICMFSQGVSKALDLTLPFELLMALDLTNGVEVTFECLKPENLIMKIFTLVHKQQKWDIINLFCQEIFHEFKHSVMDEIDTNRQT